MFHRRRGRDDVSRIDYGYQGNHFNRGETDVRYFGKVDKTPYIVALGIGMIGCVAYLSERKKRLDRMFDVLYNQSSSTDDFIDVSINDDDEAVFTFSLLNFPKIMLR